MSCGALHRQYFASIDVSKEDFSEVDRIEQALPIIEAECEEFWHVLDPAEDDGIGNARTIRRRRHVAFASVHIREYSTVLGDHPCCPYGMPLSLGWTVVREVSVELEAYEAERGPRRAPSAEGLRLDGAERRRRVLGGLEIDVAAVLDASERRRVTGHRRRGGDGDTADDATGGGGGEQPRMRPERRPRRERACSGRAHRGEGCGFFLSG